MSCEGDFPALPSDCHPRPSHHKAISACLVIISLSVGCKTFKIKETIKKKQDNACAEPTDHFVH